MTTKTFTKLRVFVALALLMSGGAQLTTAQSQLDSPVTLITTRSEKTDSTQSIVPPANAENVELVGQIGGTTNAVVVQGNYAYIGVGPRLVILSISNPVNPVIVGQTSPLLGHLNDIAVVGSYAYVVTDYSGLQIINVSNPAAPSEVGFYDTPGNAQGLAVAGNYAYVADGNSGLRIVNVSNPAVPSLVGSYDTPGFAFGVAVAGNYAYVADNYSLRIINVSDPAAPSEVGFYTPTAPEAPVDVAVAGSYAFIVSYYGLEIINISNPAAPSEVGFYGALGTWGITVMGSYAYITNSVSGLRIINVSNPVVPSLVGFYDTPGSAQGVAVVGNYAYVADNSSLRIINISNPTVPSLVGFYDTPGEAKSVAVAGNYAYVADNSSLRIINVSNLAVPSLVGFYDTLGNAQGLAVTGNYAYVADWDRGLRIINISNPAAPSEVGFYDTPGNAEGLAVVGNYAYVADNSSLRIINISNPAVPSLVGFYDTPGNAQGVAVVGNYAYVADNSSLRIINISNPAVPSLVGFYNTPGEAKSVAVTGNYAYVADGYSGLRIINISNPVAPNEVGFYDMAGNAENVAIAGNYAYVAYNADGLLILRFTNGVVGPPYSISPIYPTSNDILSAAMRGGTAYRHFRLFGAGNWPVPNAKVAFSTGISATTDVNGYFTATISADALGGPGSYQISVQSVTEGGQTTSTNGQPVFGVEITERRYAHSWEYGAVKKGSAGVDIGLIAYLAGETNGGLSMTLDESDPDITTDDQVKLAESYAGEAGVGFGADFSPSLKGGLTKVEGPGAHLVGELLIRTEASVSSAFANPYQKEAREAQGLMLLASIADSISGFPSQPYLADILARANIVLPYDEVSVGAGVHEHVDLGIDGLQLSFLVGKQDAEMNAIDLDLLAADGDMTILVGHKYYATQISEFCILALDWQTSTLSVEIGSIKNLVGNYVGDYIAVVEEEVFYDLNTGEVNQIELSITGRGNDLTFTDIDQSRVTIHYIIPAEYIDQATLNAAYNLNGLIRGVASSDSASLKAGNNPIRDEVNGLLSNVDFVEYEITTEDGSQLNIMPEIGLEFGIKLDLGAGLELKQARELVSQQGVILSGQPYVTASYVADSYVSRAGKDWLQLSANAIGGLWDLVKDAFSWVSQQVTSGVQWTLNVVAHNVTNIIQGGAQLFVPSSAQLQAPSTSKEATIQVTSPITVTAIGWTPDEGASVNGPLHNPANVTASGSGFVVGGLFEFQPYTLTISPGATLVITYADAAATGINENQLSMFRWNPNGNNWQPINAQGDSATNTFTATVTQLGTYALGYDATPPQINISNPVSGSTIATAQPLISALVGDTGVGINPATVQMTLDGQVVASTFITGTGQLAYLSNAPLENGQHTVTVSAADVVGNDSIATATFTVNAVKPLYLPLILK